MSARSRSVGSPDISIPRGACRCLRRRHSKPADLRLGQTRFNAASSCKSKNAHRPTVPPVFTIIIFSRRGSSVRQRRSLKRIIRLLLEAISHALQDLRHRPRQPRREILTEKTLSGCRPARCCSSAQEAQPSCSRIFIPSGESVPRCSRSFIALATARLPMSKRCRRHRAAGLSPRAPDLSLCIASNRSGSGSSHKDDHRAFPAAARAISKSVKC